MLTGLTDEQVNERIAEGKVNADENPNTRTYKQIIRENTLTFFNFLNLVLLVLVLLVGSYKNAFFVCIIVINPLIGIAQEIRAKKTIDKLAILTARKSVVIREGQKWTVPTEELVLDDVVCLKTGDQVPADARVLEGSVEVNESLLTGESDEITKNPGDHLMSGSFIVAGECHARLDAVGVDSYISKLTLEAKAMQKGEQSEMIRSLDKLVKFVGIALIPIGIILFVQSFFFNGDPFRSSITSMVAAVIGMIPEGLYLLASVAMAVSAMRLAKQKVLLHDMKSIETLARVNVLCVDKTGTITNGKLTVDTVMEIGAGLLGKALPQGEPEKLVQSYLAASDDNNATFQALKEAFGGQAFYTPAHKIPFSSKRKWGCISFAGSGSVFVGAPEKLMRKLPGELEQRLEEGCRVIIVGYVPMQWEDEAALPEEIQPLYGVVLEDTIRENTRETLEFFHREGVDVKVISGDHVKTVSMIAKRAGLHRWKDAVDLSTLGEDIDYEQICQQYAVFARVTPGQKKELVCALKRQGHQVAMTGDGVNDLLALREADCSIAVADGSDASRQIAQVVLLDSDFTNLPQVVMEGRKVVNNVTRTASVFFIKTIYSVLVSVICLLANIPFPFIPIQITVLDAAIEGYPSFFTIWESDTRKIRGRFLKTALSNALPFALTVTAMVAVTSIIAPFTVEQRQTVMYFLLIFISMAAVVKSCIPFNGLRTFICITMVIGTFGGLAILPSLFEISAITAGMGKYLLAGGSLSVVCLLLLLGTRGVLGRKRLSEAEAVR